MIVTRLAGTVTAGLIVVAVAVLIWWRPGRPPRQMAVAPETPAADADQTTATGTPPQSLEGGFASSAACKQCHSKFHESWSRSFHRGMTQAVTPQTVLAGFDGQTLESRGRSYRLWRDDDQFWVDMVDPEWDFQQRQQASTSSVDDPPRVQRRIVMSTGSHHYQTYWINGTSGNQLWQVPWVFHVELQRWLPAEDAFLTPPDGPRRLTTWNDNCIQCHVVRGQPGLDRSTQTFRSRVVELGIACEACHGPGAEHVRRQREAQQDPAGSNQPDQRPGIVNPATLSHHASSQVCGQCHSYFSFSDESFWTDGFRYRAGDDLHATRVIHNYHDAYVQSRPDLLSGYWQDGTMRIAGREFSAMDDSACYQQGTLSCLSCHTMHDFEHSNDQLIVGMNGDEACLQCHSSMRDSIAGHTHHAADSVGSRCLNCHMPYTSYGLLKSIRSHRIDSPTAAMTSEFGRPNACNLCHLDRTLQWTAEYLTQWYGQPSVQLQAADQHIASSVLFLMAGDAVQRAVVAGNYGWPPARQAAGHDWQPPVLAQLLNDPYAAVRFTAHQSLRTYPGFESLDYDYIAPEPERQTAVARALDLWQPVELESVRGTGVADMFDETGRLKSDYLPQLIRFRNDRPLQLPE